MNVSSLQTGKQSFNNSKGYACLMYRYLLLLGNTDGWNRLATVSPYILSMNISKAFLVQRFFSDFPASLKVNTWIGKLCEESYIRYVAEAELPT